MNNESLKIVVPAATISFLFALFVLIFFTRPIKNTKLTEEQATYCARVAAGDWPDFHHSYTAECEATFGPAEPFVPYTERK